MNVDNIVNRHGYSTELASFLKKLYIELVAFFKDEEIVYNALLNTPIKSVSNVYDYLKDNKLLDDNEFLVSSDDLKRCSGVSHSEPNIVYDANTKTYEILNINRVVLVVNLDLTKPHSAGTTIHEICHLIKSYFKEYTIEGDILIERSGLVECYYKLGYDGVKVTKTLIKEIGIGLEEGLNSVAEEEIGRKIISPLYQSTGYQIVNALARRILSINNLQDIIIAAEIYQDSKELENTIGEENYTKLKEVLDKIYKLGLIMFAQAFDKEKMQQTANEITMLIQTEYKEIIDKIENDLKLS